MTGQRGGAVVETVFAAGLAALFVAGSVAVGRVALDRRRSVALARHAAALAAMGVPADDVIRETESHAARLNAGGRLVCELGRFTETAASRFYQLTAATVRGEAPLPPLLGGGTLRWVDRAVVEKEAP